METRVGIRIIDYQNIHGRRGTFSLSCDGEMVEQDLMIHAMHRNKGLVGPVVGAMPHLTISLGARPQAKVHREHITNSLSVGRKTQPVHRALAWLQERNFAFQSSLLGIVGMYNAINGQHLIYINSAAIAPEEMSRVWDHEVEHFLDYIDPSVNMYDFKDRTKAVGIQLGTRVLFALGVFGILSLVGRDRRRGFGGFLSDWENRAAVSVVLTQIPSMPIAKALHYQIAKAEISARQGATDFPTPQNYFNRMFSIQEG